MTRDEDGNSVPSATAKELQEYYEEIMTDEYQDSNYVQEMILTSISRGPEQSPYLFMVGDVKQDVYKRQGQATTLLHLAISRKIGVIRLVVQRSMSTWRKVNIL